MVMLIRKMLRDIWKNKVPFLAIFLMLFAGNFIFSGITSEYTGMSQYFHWFIQETNMADAWVFGKQFSEQTIDQLKEETGILDAEKRMLLPSTLDTKQKQAIDLYILDNQNNISAIKITKGKAYSKSAKGIWLDVTFAKENNLHLNDKISLNINGINIEQKIIGLCCHPEYIYNIKDGEMTPDHKKNGFIFMNKTSFPYPKLIQWNQLVLQGGHNLSDSIKHVLGNSSITILLQKEHPSYSMLNDEIKQHKEIGIIFASVFLFIAVLVTITTVHRLLNSQRLQIGILKSLGFKNSKLYFHYISHSAVICLIGSFLGWCAGYAVLPNLILPIIQTMYVIPVLKTKILPFSWLLPIVCSFVCLIISIIICKKYLAGNAAKILYSNTVEKKYKELPFPFLHKYLSFYSQWNTRDIFRNKLRSAMTIFGVSGCIALLFASLSLYTSMNHMSVWAFDKVQNYDTKITGDFSDSQFKNKLISAMNGEELMEASIEVSWKNQVKSASFTGIESQSLIHLMKDEKTEIQLSEGIALSQNTADSLGVKAGNRIRWRLQGTEQWYKSKISYIIRTPLSQGITMTKKEMKKHSIPFFTTSIIGDKPISFSLNSDSITSIQDRVSLKSGFNTMFNASLIMFGIFLIAAVLLGTVILYNLGTLSYMERYKDMATLKVLGFSNLRIQKLMIQQNIWLTLLGIVVGLPVGYALLLTMLSTVQNSIDITIYIPPYVYTASILGTYLLSWLINKCLAHKVYHIDMVAALKANE